MLLSTINTWLLFSLICKKRTIPRGNMASSKIYIAWDTGNTLAKSQILGGVRASVPRSTIITQGWQAITKSCGRYRVYKFSKPVTHKQKHRNRRISTQNVKNMFKFTPITVSLPGNAVLRHNCTQKFHLAGNLRIPNVFWTSKLPVTTSHDKCSRSGWPLK